MTTINIVPSDEGAPIVISEQVANYLEAVKEFQTISQGDIKVPIRRQVLQKVIDFCNISECKDFKLPSVKTNDLKVALSGVDNADKYYEFLSQYQNEPGKNYSTSMAELFKAATHLRCKPLINLIGLLLATVIYFEDTPKSHIAIKERLGVTADLTVADDERYMKIFR